MAMLPRLSFALYTNGAYGPVLLCAYRDAGGNKCYQLPSDRSAFCEMHDSMMHDSMMQKSLTLASSSDAEAASEVPSLFSGPSFKQFAILPDAGLVRVDVRHAGQCAGLTLNKVSCQLSHLPGSRYCRWHQGQQR
jgi:hypothetical protein